MKPVITKFNDKTGDFKITILVPFTLKDRIEYVDRMVADIPKYEDIIENNVFDLIRENQELKKRLEVKEAQQKEFIEYLEKEIVDSRAGSGQQYYVQNHLRLYKEIIGDE